MMLVRLLRLGTVPFRLLRSSRLHKFRKHQSHKRFVQEKCNWCKNWRDQTTFQLTELQVSEQFLLKVEFLLSIDSHQGVYQSSTRNKQSEEIWSEIWEMSLLGSSWLTGGSTTCLDRRADWGLAPKAGCCWNGCRVVVITSLDLKNRKERIEHKGVVLKLTNASRF